MRFFRRASTASKHLGVLPGTFNPITVAHVALARAALSHVDEVVFVLPRVFPHKDYSGASFEDRVAMLEAALDHPDFSIASADGGLFVEIARECRLEYGPHLRVSVLCGRDAAERIIGWDYGRPNAVAEMYGIEPEKFAKDLQKRNGLIEIYDQVMNEKVIDLLQQNAKIEDVAPAAAAAPEANPGPEVNPS